ncbi:initiator tRNA phosphoribosyl transferase [Rhizopus delemar RA 99-880]|uniref:Initiator tRNA phosphoribosyl transferase n=1 Tax=Rhizopus delemar (strain RA 99-880 / ATCC MYA-4621 / FGSC 9543 / NRRL 43880) TaxID=246409 RepID=I1BHM4_RHIO9|nr:initiator tRNA phosphoribosyl transferase [Rhizopus delemar RA 99-880]|eukprot:EIE75704.1 initiator tRNA phosphoribosyl transferase [Rhizopus delemar RA 99-880]
MTVADLFPTLALVAYSAYFKSTDGHMHIWDFSIRRNNLHLIPLISQHHGCIIVDSTRKGKRIPDALSKTIPIWCCTINRAVHRIRPREAWDIDFHSLPSVVSPSEHAQIESKIELLTDKLMQSGIDLISVSDQLKKPLRPIWYTPQSSHAADFEESPFWPVICLSASEAVENGYQSRPGYLYVQGSGDDQEAWSFGLTPTLFWNHQEYILSNKTDCEERVKELVKEIGSDQNNNHSFAFIDPTTIAIGGSVSSLFDVIINCSLEQKLVSDSIDYLHLPIPEGKDHSVGIALSILVKYFDLNGQLQVKDNSRVDKKVIQHQLVRIISSWEKASPSRTTLKKVNMYFMSHSVS